MVYLIARKGFGFSREWSAPLASGISICGVAAAIATGGAIRARPQVPVLVSSMVVIFAVIEVMVLPAIAEAFMSHEPLVAAAWMGLAVKTDGAAIAAGGITQALIGAKAAAEGVVYQPGWMLAVTATVKVFIDIFIGVWAFILAYIWTNHIDPPRRREGETIEIWQRFPKFILGFVATFAIALALALGTPAGASGKLAAAIGEANVLRVIFFTLTFFSSASCRTSATVGGRARQAGGGLCRLAVRLRHLGRVRHLVAFLRRDQAAAGFIKEIFHAEIRSAPRY